MRDFAQLGIEVDSRAVKSSAEDLDHLARRGAATEKNVAASADKMSKAFRVVAVQAAKMAGALVGALASGRFLSTAVRDAEALERQMLRMNAVINATGGVAGRSADQLHAQARELARATLASTEGIMEAQTRLLTFRNIRGEVFDEAIKASLDLAEAMGTDVTSAAMQLARALEDPVRGVTALTRSGTVFTEAQREMIKGMVDAGNVAGAQRFILAELEAQYGGVAVAAAQGLGGALDGLRQSVYEAGLAMVQAFGLNTAAEAGIRALDAAVAFLGENMGVVRGMVLASAIALTAVYAPAIISAATATGVWVASLITLRGALLAVGIGALIVGAGMLIDFLIRLREATGSWGEALALLGQVALGVWEGIKTSAASIPDALSAVWSRMSSSFLEAVSGMAYAWADFVQGVANAARGMSNIEVLGMRPFEGMGVGIQGVATGALGAANDIMTASLQARSAADASAARASDALASGFDMAREAAARLNEVVNGTTESTTAATEAARGLTEELDGMAGGGGETGGGGARGAAKAVDELDDAVEDAASGMDSFKSSAESAFADIVTGSRSAREAIASLLKDMANLLARSAFRSLTAAIGIPGFANGTSFAPGGLALVGERGPELVNLPRGSQVHSNEDSRKMLGANVSVNIDARGAQQGVAEQIARLVPEIERRIVRVVQDRSARGAL